MSKIGSALVMMGLLAATTIGAGIFTLPWIFQKIGWGWTLATLIFFALLVVFAEYCYWKILEAVSERQRLVGLARTHLGHAWGTLAVVGVVGGMFFTLVVYLVLAERFLGAVLPLSGRTDLLIFWVAAVVPATFNIRRFAAFESVGTLCKCLLILFVLLAAAHPAAMFRSAPIGTVSPLWYFGVILFALSGWNAIEPMYEFWRKGKSQHGATPLAILTIAVSGIVLLYTAFAAGILGSLASPALVSPDTLSGLIGWPQTKIALLALLGLLALWTPYAPTMLEAENALHKDLRWPAPVAFAFVALVPLLLVFVGAVNLIQTLSFAGTIFAGLQYVTIFALGLKVLHPSPKLARCMWLAAAIFAFAVLYEVYIVVVH